MGGQGMLANHYMCPLLLPPRSLQSHASYSACQLGSSGTDRLVGLVQECIAERRAAGKPLVLYGAKITGGKGGRVTLCLCLGGADRT
jgi:L-arabinokinase